MSKIIAGKDIAAVHARGEGYATSDLARIFSGDDPMGAIADKLGDKWASNMQKLLIKTLDGVFAAASMATQVKDISAVAGKLGIVSAEALIEAIYLLGDNYDQLSGLAMHSAVMQKLAKLNLIDYLPDSEGRPGLPVYMGKTVIVDDGIAPSTIVLTPGTKEVQTITPTVSVAAAGTVKITAPDEDAKTVTTTDTSTVASVIADIVAAYAGSTVWGVAAGESTVVFTAKAGGNKEAITVDAGTSAISFNVAETTPGTADVTAKAYPIYLFGAGAIAYNERQDAISLETDRDIILGQDILTSRRVFTMHPRGIKWKGNAAGVTPTNTELATGANWELVEDAKNVLITKLVARVA